MFAKKVMVELEVVSETEMDDMEALQLVTDHVEANNLLFVQTTTLIE